MSLDGMVPDGVRALQEELRKAESALDSGGNELWGLLRDAELAPTHADAIRRIAAWAGQQIPEIHRRIVLLERIEAHDPTYQRGAPVFINSEVFAPGKPLPTVGGFWDRLWQGVQSTFDLKQNSGNSGAEVAKGAWEGFSGLAGMLWEFSEVRKTVDPGGWQRQVEDSARGLIYGVRHPVDLLKAITDWDTWVTNPDRAFGRLAPDLLMAAATAGGSSAASGATRAAGAVRKIADLIKVAKAKVGTKVAPARITPDGAWEWKGLNLRPDTNALADRALEQAKIAEQRISSDVQAVGRQLGAKMAGYPEHVLKGSDRYKEKLAKLIRRFPDRAPGELVRNEMHDGVRYTLVFDENRYAKAVADTKAAFERKGFTLVLQKATWSDPAAYKGVNMRWRSPDGQLFEVQIHTPSSLWAKEVTHEVYEYKSHLGPKEVERLEKYEKEIFEAVPVPPGAAHIPTMKKGG